MVQYERSYLMNNDFFDELNKAQKEKLNEEPSITENIAPEASTEYKDSFTDTSSINKEDTYSSPSSSGIIYTETVKKTKKNKKKFSERPIAIALCTAIATSVIFGGGLYFSMDSIKDYILKDIKTESSTSTPVPMPGSSQTASDSLSLTNQQIAALVSPSIVGISNMSYSPNSFLNINTLQSTGSGIIISEKGYIVTNNHVISNANKLKVTLSSGDELDAKLIGTDPTTDMAVIKVDPSGIELKAAAVGNSSTLQVGDEVLAIGNPLGLTLAGSVTHGIVSALNRKLTVDGSTYNLIQTDAAINSGNSGGALVNKRGEVIGINSVKISSDGVEGLGFAIPIDDVKDIINDLVTDGYVHGRPAIGVSIVEITPQIAYYYSLPVNYGLFVNDVVEGGSAEIAGIEVGDIIIAFNDEKVTTSADFIAKRNTFKAGDTITLTINREGKEKNLTLKLQEDKPSGVQ